MGRRSRRALAELEVKVVRRRKQARLAIALALQDSPTSPPAAGGNTPAAFPPDNAVIVGTAFSGQNPDLSDVVVVGSHVINSLGLTYFLKDGKIYPVSGGVGSGGLR